MRNNWEKLLTISLADLQTDWLTHEWFIDELTGWLIVRLMNWWTWWLANPYIHQLLYLSKGESSGNLIKHAVSYFSPHWNEMLYRQNASRMKHPDIQSAKTPCWSCSLKRLVYGTAYREPSQYGGRTGCYCHHVEAWLRTRNEIPLETDSLHCIEEDGTQSCSCRALPRCLECARWLKWKRCIQWNILKRTWSKAEPLQIEQAFLPQIIDLLVKVS